MANPVQVRDMLIRIGLALGPSRFCVEQLGLNSLEAWRDYHTDDSMENLAKTLRNPGGTIRVGNRNEKHPGFTVSVRAISNLQVLRLGLKHHQMIQREVDVDDIDMGWIEQWDFLVEFHKTVEAKKKNDEELPKLDLKDWAKNKEVMWNFFSEKYGQSGIPLAYLMRENSEVEPEDDDPPENYGDDFVKELIARAPHEGDVYRADCRTFLRDLKKMSHDTPAYDYISKYTADGRQAWKDWEDNFLGPQHTQLLAAKCEEQLRTLTYDGESAKFTFDRLVDLHKKAHSRLDGLEKHGYKGMDEGTKIRHLLNAIKAPSLRTVVELVRNNKDFDTFDLAVRRLKDSVVIQKTYQKKTRTVSSVSVKNAKGEEIFPGIEPDMSVADTYYSHKEWSKLSNAQKKGVMMKRMQRTGTTSPQGSGGGGAKAGGGQKQDKQQPNQPGNKRLKKRVKALEKKIASLVVQDDDDAEASGSDSEDDQPAKKKKKVTNSNNSALRRRG